jgi:signal peptide peptidase SppA
MRLLGLATHLYNRPLLVTPERAQEVERVYQMHSDGRAALLAPPAEPAQPRHELAGPGITRTDAGYYRTADGVAIIPVVGTLVQRGDALDAMSGLLSYGRLAGQLQAAIDDPRSDAILLEIDSPGGEANGLIDLAAKVKSAGKKKPVWAIANEQAFSAAYWLASSASRVFTPQTGMVGSVGVVMLHVDQSAKDAKQGITYTPIFAGSHKVDFSSHAPLSDDAKAIAQDEVDRLYEMFVQAVADGRGIDQQVVRDTQAGLLNPEAAMGAGFIDGVQSFDQTLSALAAEARQYRYRGMRAAATALLEVDDDRDFQPSETETQMAQDAKPALTAEDITAAHARGVQEGKTAAEAESAKKLAEGQAASAKAAQERVLAILGHEEAKGRTQLAQKLAATSMSADEAVEIMKAAEKTVDKPGLGARMPPNPRVGAAPDASGEQPKVINSQGIFAKRRAQAGHTK